MFKFLRKQYLYYKPDHVTYARIYRSFLAPFMGWKADTVVIHTSNSDVYYYHEPLFVINIPIDPISIELLKPNFQTSDLAQLDYVKINLQIEPDIGNGTIDEVDNFMSAYYDFDHGDLRQPDDVKKWFESLLEGLFEELRQYSFLYIHWANMTPKSRNITKFSNLIKELEKNTKLEATQKLRIDNLKSHVKDLIEGILENPDKNKTVSSVLKTKAEQILAEKNFKILSFGIDSKYPEINKDLLDPQKSKAQDLDPKVQPIIEYLQLFQNFQEAIDSQQADYIEVVDKLDKDIQKRKMTLIKERTEIKQSHQEELQKLEHQFEQNKARMENDHDKALKKLGEEHKYQMEKSLDEVKKQYELEVLEIEKEHYQAKKEKEAELEKHKLENQLNVLEVQKELNPGIWEISNEMLKEKIGYDERKTELESENLKSKELLKDYEIREINIAAEIKKAKINEIKDLEIERISGDKKIIDARNELPRDTKAINYSWEEIKKIKEAEYKFLVEEIEMNKKKQGLRLDHFQTKLSFDENIWKHEMERELQLDELKFNLLQRIFEKGILMAYSRMQIADKQEFIKNLGEQVSDALKSSSGIVDDFRIVGTPNLDLSNSSLMKILSQITTGIFTTEAFVPSLNKALKELGIKLEIENSERKKSQPYENPIDDPLEPQDGDDNKESDDPLDIGNEIF